ncbi:MULTISPECIES: hypothetical protein [Crateriforma]|uniref:HAMP domain-containing protein n=1 Tax=Crateriforma conspicua TaxID=2527996 RepID=A0A5C6FPV0_9PLAN|nr:MULTISPECIES: hypothetical protein [Crateriforma]TWU65157.1 hypothetical protein V7x_07030 [Crateriforma conspicua]
MFNKSDQRSAPREQLLIEKDVQSALLLRAALHGGALATYFTVIQFFAQSMINPEVGWFDTALRFFDEAIYWVPALILLAPLFAYDLLKLSNRFAGPVFRLRREMIRLCAGQSEEPIFFRGSDFWSDLQDPFNELREELLDLRRENERLKTELGGTAASAPPPQSDAADKGTKVDAPHTVLQEV